MNVSVNAVRVLHFPYRLITVAKIPCKTDFMYCLFGMVEGSLWLRVNVSYVSRVTK